TWEIVTTANGTSGTSANRWGDYLAVRSHGSNPQTWVATGYTLQGGSAPSNVEPRYIQFSLGTDVPPIKLDLLDMSMNPLPPDPKLKNRESAFLQATVTSSGTPQQGK